MRLRSRKSAVRALGAAAVGVGALVLAAGPASATTNDNFSAHTTGGGCGAVDFIDYGAGAPGGGNNNDYLVVHDYCSDGHGVKAWVWWYTDSGTLLYYGSKYNGNGEAGAPVYWDPFASLGNTIGGDRVSVKVCLSDGNSDPTVTNCDSASHVSADG